MVQNTPMGRGNDLPIFLRSDMFAKIEKCKLWFYEPILDNKMIITPLRQRTLNNGCAVFIGKGDVVKRYHGICGIDLNSRKARGVCNMRVYRLGVYSLWVYSLGVYTVWGLKSTH